MSMSTLCMHIIIHFTVQLFSYLASGVFCTRAGSHPHSLIKAQNSSE